MVHNEREEPLTRTIVPYSLESNPNPKEESNLETLIMTVSFFLKNKKFSFFCRNILVEIRQSTKKV